MKRSRANVDSMNGIDSPAEYTERSSMPITKDDVVAASVKILASIGPIHGVQPAPKPIPTIKDPIWPTGLFDI